MSTRCSSIMSLIIVVAFSLPIPIEVIDVDENLAMGKIYAVRSVPTLILLDDSGEEIKRNVGALKEKDLLEFIKNDQEN